MTIIDSQTFERWRDRPSSGTYEWIEILDVDDKLLDRLCKTVTAFLNSSGGLIVVCISGYERHYHNLEYDLESKCDAEIIPRPNIEVQRAEYSNHLLLIIDIPVGSERPYSFNNEIIVRDGASIQRADREVILTLLGEHEDPNARWERQIATNVTIDDLDKHRLSECFQREDVRRFIEGRENTHESLKWRFLRYFHLGHQPIIRNSAIVLFGKEPSRYFPQHAVRAVAYNSDESSASTIIDDQTFNNNLFEIIERCYYFCEKHSVFSSDFPINSHVEASSFQRIDKGNLTVLAVREAILNAIAHRSYSSYDTMITLKISPNQIEIWNPGLFPEGIDLEKLENFRVSRPPNPDIAHVLQRMGYMERLGSGINRMISIFNDCNLPRPQWEQVGGGVRVTLNFSTKSEEHLEKIAFVLHHNFEVGEVISKKRLLQISEISNDSDFDKVLKLLENRSMILRTSSNLFEILRFR